MSIIYQGDIFTDNGYTPISIEMSFDSLVVLRSYKWKDGIYDGHYFIKIINQISNKELNILSTPDIKFYNEDKNMCVTSTEWCNIYNKKENGKFEYSKQFCIKPSRDFVISPNGKYIITSGPVIWDIETLDSIQLHADPELGDMDYLDISSDGKLLAAISEEGRIVVWDIEKYITDVEENPIIAHKEMISIFPNPASDYIEINFERCPTSPRCRTSEKIEIYNVLGECVLTIPETQTPNPRVDVSDLPVGMYYVRIGGFVGRFVKI